MNGLFYFTQGQPVYWRQDEKEGWTASACTVVKSERGEKVGYPIHTEVHPSQVDFVHAAHALESAGHSPDSTFGLGSLLTFEVGVALFDAGGRRMPCQRVFDAEEVHDMAQKASRNVTSNRFTDSHLACARAFLEVCAKHKLGIEVDVQYN